jgi:hypothetical protein
LSDHAAEHDVSAPDLAGPAAMPSSAPGGLGGLGALTAMGNSAFASQFGGMGTTLSRAIMASPEAAARAPWASARDEAHQGIVNAMLLRRQGESLQSQGVARSRADDATVQSGLAAAAVARQPNPTTPGGPDPASAASGQDWLAWFADTPLNVIRSGLEITRVWPGVGAFTGLASDVANGFTDLYAIKDEDAPVVKTVLVIRNILNALNNLIGHVNYLGQLISDAALLSVIGAELTAIADAIGMTLKEIKILLDLAIGIIDIGLWAAAEQKARNAGPAGKAAWQGMVANYRANMIGDLATLLVDCWDAATATEGQGEMTKEALYSVRGFLQATRKFGPTLINWIQGLFNVWGSKATASADASSSSADAAAPAAPVPAVARVVAGPTVARLDVDGSSVARKAASMVIVNELTQAKIAYGMADQMIDVAAQVVPHIVAHMEEQMRVVLGGRDPFEFFRDAGANILHSLSERAGALENAAVLSSSGKEKADAVRAGCDRALGVVDSLRLPSIDIPGADLLLGPVRGAMDSAKNMARAPINDLRGSADEVAEFLQIFADGAREQVGWCRQQLQELSEGLARCNSFEDVANLMLGKIQEVLGTGTNMTVQDIRNYWNELGPQIDAAMQWAIELGQDGPVPAAPAAAATAPATPADPSSGGASSAPSAAPLPPSAAGARAGATPGAAGAMPAAPGAAGSVAAPAPPASPGPVPGAGVGEAARAVAQAAMGVAGAAGGAAGAAGAAASSAAGAVGSSAAGGAAAGAAGAAGATAAGAAGAGAAGAAGATAAGAAGAGAAGAAGSSAAGAAGAGAAGAAGSGAATEAARREPEPEPVA